MERTGRKIISIYCAPGMQQWYSTLHSGQPQPLGASKSDSVVHVDVFLSVEMVQDLHIDRLVSLQNASVALDYFQ